MLNVEAVVQRADGDSRDKMAVAMMPDQLQTLIAAIQAGGGGGAAGAAGPMAAAAMVGPMGPCTLSKDKLKRPKRWADWHKDAENKMRFSGITDSVQKLNFMRSCAGAVRGRQPGGKDEPPDGGDGGGEEAEADRQVQQQAQGRGGEGVVPKMHI